VGRREFALESVKRVEEQRERELKNEGRENRNDNGWGKGKKCLRGGKGRRV
jgi:hypothetical protein